MARQPLGFLLRLFGVLLVLSGLGATPTREEILATAEDFAGLTWYADSVNTVAWDSMYTLYGCEEHLKSDWEAGQTYQGMAYSYGGNDDTLAYMDKLADSLAAGNHMCHYENYGAETGIYPPDWATGIDCSAFVCRCWEVPRTNTTGLYNKYYPLEKTDVEPGDILVNPGSHTVLIADPGETPGYGTFALYEASGSAARVWYNPAASWSSYSSYSARSLFKPSSAEPEPDTADTLRTGIACEPSPAKGMILLRFPNTWGEGDISYEIYNTAGERVYRSEVGAPGFETLWYGEDNLGRKLPSGTYFVRSIRPRKSDRIRFVFLR